MGEQSIERLRAVARLCVVATPGPWVHRRDDGGRGVSRPGEDGSDDFIVEEGSNGTRADLDFIAAARTVLPEILAEIARLTADLENEHGHAREMAEELCEASAALSALGHPDSEDKSLAERIADERAEMMAHLEKARCARDALHEAGSMLVLALRHDGKGVAGALAALERVLDPEAATAVEGPPARATLADRIAATRAELDRLNARFDSYGGGDRPMSPPAALLRELRETGNRYALLKAEQAHTGGGS